MTGYEVIALYSLVIGIPIVIIFVAVIGITKKGKLSKIEIIKIILEGALLQYMITLLAVTLWPTAGFRRASVINLVPFVELFDAIMGNKLLNPAYVIRVWCYNVLMFVPFGILGVIYLQMLKKKQEKVLFFGICLILIIEGLQYFFINGRAADINDVITNMLGVFIGYLIGRLLLNKALQDIIEKLEKT